MSRRRYVVLAALSAVSVFTSGARAAEWTWAGGSSVDGNWATPENWSPASVPVSGPSTDLVFNGNARPDGAHGAFTVNSITFGPTAGGFDIQSTGPLTFVADDTQPMIQTNSNTTSAVPILRGDLIIPAGVALTSGGTGLAVIQLGTPMSASGGSRFGGAGARGGVLNLEHTTTLSFDNGRVTPGDRGMELDSINVSHSAGLRVGNSSFVGPGVSFDVPVINFADSAVISFSFDPAGANGNRLGFGSTAFNGGEVLIMGDTRKSGARTDVNAPRVTSSGTVSVTGGALQLGGNVTLDRDGSAPTVVYDASILLSATDTGTVWFGTYDPDPSHTLQFGGDASDRISVDGSRGPVRAVFDNTLGATGSVSSKRLLVKANLSIGEGGTVEIRNSATITSGGGMEFDGDIDARGKAGNPATLLLQTGSGPTGVTFGPNTQLKSTFGGWLRIEGTAANIGNLLTPARLGSSTVPFLIVAPTDAPFDLGGNLPAAATLTVVNSNPNGTDVRINGSVGAAVSSEIRIEPGASIDAAHSTFKGAVRGLGTISGPVTFTGALTANAAQPGTFSSGVLTTGDITLTDAAVLTVECSKDRGTTSLHVMGNVVLEMPLGPNSGPRLDIDADAAFAVLHYGETFPLLTLDAGYTLTGQFERMPDGYVIDTGYGTRFILNYNRDSGDGSANDVVLTAVPEPGAVAVSVVALAGGILSRRRRPR